MNTFIRVILALILPCLIVSCNPSNEARVISITDECIISNVVLDHDLIVEEIIGLEKPLNVLTSMRFSKAVFFDRFIYCLEPLYDSSRLYQFDRDGSFIQFINVAFNPLDIYKVAGELEIISYNSLVTLHPSGEIKQLSSFDENLYRKKSRVVSSKSADSHHERDTIFELDGNRDYVPKIIMDYSESNILARGKIRIQSMHKNGSWRAANLLLDDDQYIMLITKQQAKLYNLNIQSGVDEAIILKVVGISKNRLITFLTREELKLFSDVEPENNCQQFLVILKVEG